jgi:hypothetical protein
MVIGIKKNLNTVKIYGRKIEEEEEVGFGSDIQDIDSFCLRSCVCVLLKTQMQECLVTKKM